MEEKKEMQAEQPKKFTYEQLEQIAGNQIGRAHV